MKTKLTALKEELGGNYCAVFYDFYPLRELNIQVLAKNDFERLQRFVGTPQRTATESEDMPAEAKLLNEFYRRISLSCDVPQAEGKISAESFAKEFLNVLVDGTSVKEAAGTALALARESMSSVCANRHVLT